MCAWLVLQGDIAETFRDPRLTKRVLGPGKHGLMFEGAQHGPTWGMRRRVQDGTGLCNWSLNLKKKFFFLIGKLKGPRDS